MALCAASPAEAGGFYSPYQSATAIGTAFAGASVRSDDASFFLYNPATISALEGSQSYLDLRAFAPFARITPDQAVSPLGADVTGDGASGNIVEAAIAPGSVAAWRFAPGWTLGWGGLTSYATDVETGETWAGRYHLLQARMVSMALNAAVSYEVSPKLAIAAGLTGDYFETRFENTAVLPITGVGFVDATAVMKGTDWGMGAVAGLVVSPAEGTRIGVSYHSEIRHCIDGIAFARFPGIPPEATRYRLDLPQYATLGLEQRIDASLRLFGEVQWVDWSSFKGFDISFPGGRPNEVRPVEWKDTWLFAVGFAYAIDAATEVTAGVHYDTAASESGSGLTLSPDAKKTTVAIGLSHDIAGFGRATLSYAHVFAADAPVFASNVASGSLRGTLDARVDMIGVGFTKTW